jgi:heme-degrading monooxygenase HmoA
MNNATLTALGWGKTPEPPYYVAIFTWQRTDNDDGLGAMVERMAEIVRQQPGFLAMDSAEGTDGIGIVVAYWEDDESIRGWKLHLEHLEAQKLGREQWFKRYQVRVGRVERAYGFNSE